MTSASETSSIQQGRRERERYRAGDLEIDVGAAWVAVEGSEVELPKLSFDLLLALLRLAPDVGSADELVNAVWPQTAVSDETLTQRVALLRRALGDDARSPRYVRSVRGRGYQMVPAVERLEADQERAASAPLRRRLSQAWWAGFAAVGVLAVVWAVGSRSWRAEPPVESPSSAVSVQELVRQADQYLGRQREVDTELAIDLYRQALARRGDDLGALVGLSFALGQRATKFNQSEAADQAESLARQALAIDADHAAAHQALGLALDAQAHLTAAIVAYRRAYELAPERVSALASAGYLLTVQGRLAEGLAADATARSAAESTSKPLPYVEIQIGNTLDLLGFEATAESWFERTITLQPDNIFAALGFARFRLGQGRLEDAERIASSAVKRGVRRPELLLALADVALLRGDPARAAGFLADAAAIHPEDGGVLHRTLVFERLHAEGREPRSKAGDVELAAVAESLAAERAAGDEWPDLDETLLWASIGRTDRAFVALDAAIGLGFRDADWLLADPLAAPLRERPGLRDRIERIRLLAAQERAKVESDPTLRTLLAP